MKTVKQTNIEGRVDEIAVVDAQEIKSKKGSVTMKTLKAWLEQTEKICNDELLTSKERATELRQFAQQVKANFIALKF